MTTHDLNVSPEDFAEIASGARNYAVRERDRDFEPGDWLKLREYRPADILNAVPGAHTGQRIMRRVLHVTDAEHVALREGFVILSLAPPISELGCKLQGYTLFLGTTDMSATHKATQYLMQLHELVEEIGREKKRRKR